MAKKNYSKDPIRLIRKGEQEGIPTFTFIATDKHAIEVLKVYKSRLATDGMVDCGFHKDFSNKYRQFIAWQEQNPDKVHSPD